MLFTSKFKLATAPEFVIVNVTNTMAPATKSAEVNSGQVTAFVVVAAGVSQVPLNIPFNGRVQEPVSDKYFPAVAEVLKAG
ncbi:MAG: hypothetical protein J6T34_01435, partial [Bacilli bacterium]|nr:hypothetical protein [Bacilli bacterium]